MQVRTYQYYSISVQQQALILSGGHCVELAPFVNFRVSCGLSWVRGYSLGTEDTKEFMYILHVYLSVWQASLGLLV